MYVLGIDVGGTFTDLVAIDSTDGKVLTTKVPSRRDKPMAALVEGVSELGLLDGSISRVVHGTTVATNAFVERRGSVTALVTTHGFRDTIEIGRGRRLVHGSMFDTRFRRAQPLVPRQLRFEIKERLNAAGDVIEPIDRDELAKTAAAIRGSGARAVAVCFLHAYTNPDHEAVAIDMLRAALGDDFFVCSSSEVDPQFREFERFSTTVVNAYVGPVMGDYLASLQREAAPGIPEPPTFIMGSAGGVMDFDMAARLPVRTILSGPAGGVMAARSVGDHLSIDDIITCDMGGTSSDVALLKGSRLLFAGESVLTGIPIRASQLEINTIGAGAGSIIWIDVDGALRVGPMSASAAPGPACYGLGGVEPTVTDANVVLNRIGDGTLLGGKIRVDAKRAEAAFAKIQQRLGLRSVREAAEGSLDILAVKAVSAIREISLERGFDPRDFALMGFGGAGPMHACFIAEGLGMRRVIVPTHPGALSAMGLVTTRMRRERIASFFTRTSMLDLKALRQTTGNMVEEVRGELRQDGVLMDTVALSLIIDMRLRGQAHEIAVQLDADPTALTTDSIEAIFALVYRERYGQPPRDDIDREIMALRVIGDAEIDRFPNAYNQASASGELPSTSPRLVWFRGAPIETMVYHRSGIVAGGLIDGPAIIDEFGATTVVPPGWRAEARAGGHLVIERIDETEVNP